jgi:hypothetical protein
LINYPAEAAELQENRFVANPKFGLRAQITRHFAKRFQQNSVCELTAGRIACTAERHSADIPLSSHKFAQASRIAAFVLMHSTASRGSGPSVPAPKDSIEPQIEDRLQLVRPLSQEGAVLSRQVYEVSWRQWK